MIFCPSSKNYNELTFSRSFFFYNIKCNSYFYIGSFILDILGMDVNSKTNIFQLDRTIKFLYLNKANDSWKIGFRNIFVYLHQFKIKNRPLKRKDRIFLRVIRWIRSRIDFVFVDSKKFRCFRQMISLKKYEMTLVIYLNLFRIRDFISC